MDEEKLRESVALLRHQIISPVIMESKRNQEKYFYEAAKRDYDVPGVGIRRYAVSTMKGWLNKYRKHGFKGLMPGKRSDRGIQKAISEEQKIRIRELRDEYMGMSVMAFHRLLVKREVFSGKPPSETFYLCAIGKNILGSDYFRSSYLFARLITLI